MEWAVVPINYCDDKLHVVPFASILVKEYITCPSRVKADTLSPEFLMQAEMQERIQI